MSAVVALTGRFDQTLLSLKQTFGTKWYQAVYLDPNTGLTKMALCSLVSAKQKLPRMLMIAPTRISVGQTLVGIGH